jgi:hypothetical protein
VRVIIWWQHRVLQQGSAQTVLCECSGRVLPAERAQPKRLQKGEFCPQQRERELPARPFCCAVCGLVCVGERSVSQCVRVSGPSVEETSTTAHHRFLDQPCVLRVMQCMSLLLPHVPSCAREPLLTASAVWTAVVVSSVCISTAAE